MIRDLPDNIAYLRSHAPWGMLRAAPIGLATAVAAEGADGMGAGRRGAQRGMTASVNDLHRHSSCWMACGAINLRTRKKLDNLSAG